MNQNREQLKVRMGRVFFYLPIIAAVFGALLGYLYYRFVGCVTGTCAITSNPVNSTIYGGVIGLLLGVAFAPDRAKLKKNQEEQPHA